MAGPLDWKDLMPEKTIAEDIAIDKAHKREYLIADGKGNYRVVVEGIDKNGNVGRSVMRYVVK